MDPTAPHRLAIQYARFIDGREFDRLAEIMTEDVQISSGGFNCDGLAAFREQLKILDEFQTTLHRLGISGANGRKVATTARPAASPITYTARTAATGNGKWACATTTGS